MSKWAEIKSDYYDDEEKKQYVDACLTDDGNEEGKVITKINLATKEAEYLDSDYRKKNKMKNINDMDERNVYYAMRLTLNDESDDINEVVTELYDHLKDNGYHFFLANEPGFEQILVLLIWEEETGYIDTILKDRGINFEYVVE